MKLAAASAPLATAEGAATLTLAPGAAVAAVGGVAAVGVAEGRATKPGKRWNSVEADGSSERVLSNSVGSVTAAQSVGGRRGRSCGEGGVGR